MKYIVQVKEVHNAEYIVEADSPEEAKEKAQEEMENGDLPELIYSHTLDRSLWDVDETN
jgi:hypothetical protein